MAKSELNIAYRAFKEYRRLAETVPEIRTFLASLHSTGESTESVRSITTVCRIDSDWVTKINDALPAVADAIAEERQFIRSEGEVVDIEKVRVVGKDSVVDLAKHSNYITRSPDAEGHIIPDKLLMPKKDSDYNLYENRFLYSLLVYLSQFIEIRLNDILSLSGKYEAETEIVKRYSTPTLQLKYELKMSETRYNDPYAEKIHSSDDMLDLIKKNLSIIKSLLQTPLMKSVRNAPMVKPPIVKTNVFLFDHNFKESLALYEYLISYDKKGYSTENISRKIEPFTLSMSDDFMELIYLASFLTYEYGNNLSSSLEKNYQEENARQKEEEEKKILSELRMIDKEARLSSISPEEYAIKLRKGKQILEKRLSEQEKRTLEAKNDCSAKLQEQRLDMEKEKQEAIAFEKKHTEEVRKEAEEEKEKELAQKDEVIRQKDEAIAAKENQIDDLQKQIEQLQQDIQDLKKKNVFLSGSVNALRQEVGRPSDIDFTDEKNFGELEEEKKTFDKYFNAEWKKAKKRIRKETLSIPDSMKKKKKDSLKK